jgi:hypothetical protein
MAYYVFIDESGDHSLKSIDQNYPLLVICGAIFRSTAYNIFDGHFNEIKNHFWGRENVIFRSYDIRKYKKDFEIFKADTASLTEFIQRINLAISANDYHVISSYLNKQTHLDQYAAKAKDAYHVGIGLLLERLVFYLNKYSIYLNEKVYLVIECRTPTDDKRLKAHIIDIITKGTPFLSPQRFTPYSFEILFRYKKQNVNGLQLADLLAFPIGQKVFKPNEPNLPYSIMESKFYKGDNGQLYGLKIWP